MRHSTKAPTQRPLPADHHPNRKSKGQEPQALPKRQARDMAWTIPVRPGAAMLENQIDLNQLNFCYFSDFSGYTSR